MSSFLTVIHSLWSMTSTQHWGKKWKENMGVALKRQQGHSWQRWNKNAFKLDIKVKQQLFFFFFKKGVKKEVNKDRGHTWMHCSVSILGPLVFYFDSSSSSFAENHWGYICSNVHCQKVRSRIGDHIDPARLSLVERELNTTRKK